MTVDVVFPGTKIGLFVDGCFWHGHTCRTANRLRPLGPNAEGWAAKLEAVKAREALARRILEEGGYVVLRLWECEVAREPGRAADRVATVLWRLAALTKGK
jgi:DNA mismatch endonuclease, patch repair protein